jgi:DNA-binding NtrC family response regulator
MSLGARSSAGRVGTDSRREPLRLLVVDDDQLHARLLKANLDRPGRVQVEVAASSDEAMQRLRSEIVDAVLVDLLIPGMDGLALVQRIRALSPGLPLFLMTANATVEQAVDGIRAGATEFLQKPLNVTAVMALIERAVAERPLREELTEAQERRAATSAGNLVFGRHALLESVRGFARQVAQTPYSRVLITGESGTGKTLLARLIHDLSGVPGRFVEINCAALPPHLLESELFGHEKGAFTDAKGLKRGLIEAADRGTLFLDEVGLLPLELQAKLLQFLEGRGIRRVGGLNPIPVQTRVVAATNEELADRVRDRTFRHDLFYRLDVASVEMPALRRIPEVIPELAQHFTREICAELKRPLPAIGPHSFERLGEHSWPGNIRELRNAVERAIIFYRDGTFEVTPPPAAATAGAPAAGGVRLELGLTLEEVERRYLAASLGDGPRELEEVARGLGISRKTLWEKRRRYGLP